MDRDRRNRFEDGEVTRYGAGESWRPFPRDRSPRRPRSPPRDRDRERDRMRDRDRPRSPPPIASDSYIPGRSPRRRSRSGDRFRRERSRGADTWRRRERSRTPPPRRQSPRRQSPRRLSPRRSPMGRRSPIGRSPGWRDDRGRPRSPPPRQREGPFGRRDDRRRSRSPFDRERNFSGRSPRRSPANRGNFRPRSRSTSRRGGERYPPPSHRRPSPPRDSLISSAMTSQSASGKSSPRPPQPRARSIQPSREPSPRHSAPPPQTSREAPHQMAQDNAAASSRTPPRGPAALRAPPTGPSAGRNFTVPLTSSAAQAPRNPQTPSAPPPRAEVASPTIPPSGPRGYVSTPRGGFNSRGGRGGWANGPSRHAPVPSPSPSTAAGANAIPTGPRAGSVGSLPTTPSTTSKPFNPPTGPAAQHTARPTLAQSMMATMPPLIPGGKVDPASLPTMLGVTREVEPHYRKLKLEEEKVRADLEVKQDKLRQGLMAWDKLEMESKAWKTRVDYNEQSLNGLAGDNLGGPAF